MRRVRGAGVYRVEHFANPIQRRDEKLRIATEADAQEAVHLEMIAGHDEDALLVPDALGQPGRADAMRVADEGDGARLGRNVAERSGPAFEPALQGRVV